MLLMNCAPHNAANAWWRNGAHAEPADRCVVMGLASRTRGQRCDRGAFAGRGAGGSQDDADERREWSWAFLRWTPERDPRETGYAAAIARENTRRASRPEGQARRSGSAQGRHARPE